MLYNKSLTQKLNWSCKYLAVEKTEVPRPVPQGLGTKIVY